MVILSAPMTDAPAHPPADPAHFGEAVAKLLDAVAARMPPEEVDAVWVFPGVKRDNREHGAAVVTRRLGAGRHLVYRARYVLQLSGQERGKTTFEIVETAEAPAEMLPRVIEGVRRRADEAGDAEPVDLGHWKADGERHAS